MTNCDEHGDLGLPSKANSCCLSEMELYLNDKFRLLWEQHIYWTRMVILGIAFKSPDLKYTTNRLLRNATDFAKVFLPFYGDSVASEFKNLIHDHLTIAAELVTAAKAGDSEAMEDSEKRWYGNANEIACFLTHINHCWTYPSVKAMWFEHLDLTKEEAVAILNKKYNRSIQVFGKIENLALRMADDFTNAFVCQFGCK